MEDFLMTAEEAERYRILEQHRSGAITLKQVSILLKISYIQSKRLWSKYKKEGKEGLVSKTRGQPSNRALSKELTSKALSIVHDRYYDFGPTLATEKLLEEHDILISRESLRKLMIKEHLWTPKIKKKQLHQQRPRREMYGELVQTDGSDHFWFEDRGGRCTLLVIIDDASSEILALRFEKSETTFGYFRLFTSYFERKGFPLGIYSDKASVFRVNTQGKQRNLTQFSRAMGELQIELIYANSPQAKGRVERVNGTLQDRLVKELRLRGISTMETGNAYLPTFREDFNNRFAKVPKSPFNAHRPLADEINLSRILCIKSKRILSKELELSFKGTIYQILMADWKNRLARKTVDILESEEGDFVIEYKGMELPYRKYDEQIHQPEVVNSKNLATTIEKWNHHNQYHPDKDHPWKLGWRGASKGLELGKKAATP